MRFELKNILILEDDRENNKMLSDLLSHCRETICIYSAYDEKEAMQLATECYIDLFVIDISLHGEKAHDTSGVAFAKKIRKIEHYEITPVIFVTSVANMELRTYREVSCFSYILKPLDTGKKNELLRDAEKLLKSAKRKDQKESYYFKIDSVYYPIRISDIVTIKCENRKLLVRTKKDQFYVSNITLKQVVKDLNKMGCNPFAECRRGVLVNPDYIENIDRVNKYLKVHYEENVIGFGNSKWLSVFQGVIRH